MAASMVSYSSTKPEVVFNRWKFISPETSVKWDRPQNKLWALQREYSTICRDDPPLKALLKEIYEDKRYSGRY